MENHTINKSERQKFFDLIAKLSVDQQASVEIANPDIGDQIAAVWSPLKGISYDPKEDYLFIYTDPYQHSILSPQEVVSVEDQAGEILRSIYIKDAYGNVQAVIFKEPLRLKNQQITHH